MRFNNDLVGFVCSALVIVWTIIVTCPQAVILADGQLIATDGSKLPLRFYGSERTRKCNFDCSRKRKRAVCGSDGRTYSSKCQIKKANCEGHRVTVKHRGDCPEATRCRADRTYAQKLARTPMLGIFIPECKSDGSYADIQCHASTGYCWCVNKLGKPIPGSSVQYKKPNCAQLERPTNKRRSSRGRKQKKDCSNTDRPTFTRNLIKIFKSEYLRLPTTHTAERVAPGVALDTIEKRVIEWKFSELDKNKDGKLSRKELRNLRRMVKKIVKPKACAKTFTKYCDLDQNRKITRKEWSMCLWIDGKILFRLFLSLNSDEQNGTKQHERRRRPLTAGPQEFLESSEDAKPSSWDKQMTGGSFSTDPVSSTSTIQGKVQSSSKSQESRDCQSVRQSALIEQKKNPDGATYVPECTSDGKYNESQCHTSTGYCWCVDMETGKPLPGTSTLNKKPDCRKDVEKSPRVMKGCPKRRKSRFLQELMDDLKQEMHNSSNYSVNPNTSLQQSEQEQIIRWKFTQIDTNVNRLLDRKEWKRFRRAMKADKRLRKCGRRFLRYCDENSDKKITIQEWIDCFDINEDSSGSLPSSNKRKGPNPFHTYLKSDRR